MSVETLKTDMKREKYNENMGQNIQELWKITKDLTYTEGEKRRERRKQKKYLNNND